MLAQLGTEVVALMVNIILALMFLSITKYMKAKEKDI
jgi:hypothetical protein